MQRLLRFFNNFDLGSILEGRNQKETKRRKASFRGSSASRCIRGTVNEPLSPKMTVRHIFRELLPSADGQYLLNESDLSNSSGLRSVDGTEYTSLDSMSPWHVSIANTCLRYPITISRVEFSIVGVHHTEAPQLPRFVGSL